MSVWDEIARYHYPIVFLHQHSGQPPSCLEGLVDYAALIARNKHTYGFRSPVQILAWLWMQPVKLDRGDGPKAEGCTPQQRSRVWPDDGLNCWEAVAHLLAVALVNQWLVEFHVYDALVHGGRHVFPAVRPLGDSSSLPIPLVIQPPVKTGKDTRALRVAQAWYNDLLGAVHFVGDKVLRVFGAGELADTLADVEGDELPDWARTAKQKQQRAAELIKRAAEESKREEARRGKEDTKLV